MNVPEPKRPMPQQYHDQTSGWFFYFIATALGLSFLVTLLVLAWNNVVEREVQSGALSCIELSSDYMTGAIGLTRKFKFDDNSPADRLARLLHRRAAELADGSR